jgi:hypothetical protein
MTVLCDQVTSKLDKQESMLHEQGEKLDQIITPASNVSKAAGILQAGDQPASKYATIPPEVPELPAAFQPRPALLAELKQRMLSMASSTTSLVGVSRGAVAATTSSYGMGGVGKTTIAVQLIRDTEVGAAFKTCGMPRLIKYMARLECSALRRRTFLRGRCPCATPLAATSQGLALPPRQLPVLLPVGAGFPCFLVCSRICPFALPASARRGLAHIMRLGIGIRGCRSKEIRQIMILMNVGRPAA